MKVREYLKQAYLLDQRINSHIKEKEELRAMASSISSTQLSADKVRTSPSGDAPFVRTLNKMWEMEEQISGEIDQLVKLKEQIHEVIGQVDDPDEQLVLRCRYIHNMTWEQIGMKILADERTARRCHGRALSHVVLPADPIVI